MYNSKKVLELADKILKNKNLYYQGQPQISDAKYDAIESELKSLAPNHPVLQMVGPAVSPGSTKVTHESPMLSLQKTYKFDELAKWVAVNPAVGSLKIDGNSLSLIYKHGQLTLAKTRGNGKVGENVTDKANWVGDVVPNIDTTNDIEIRGELFCTESQFVKLCENMNKLGLEKPTNPRNTVAGFLGRKSHIDLCRYFSFFAFEALFINGDRPFETEMQKFEWLENIGFATPMFKQINSEKELEYFLQQVRDVAAEDEIGIDGAVFSYNDLKFHEEMGNTAHHPRYKMSFKWQGDTAESDVKDIIWATSRLGIVTPVAVIEPVQLSGAKITNVTLHNAAHVKAFNIKTGDRIEIVRSGEVIPKFLQVVSQGEGEYEWPAVCPSCDSAVEFDEVRLKCMNMESCPSQQLGGILNWIKCAEIEDLSEKRLLPLVDLELVKTAADLYRIPLDDFFRIPNTKDKMANKLFKNIQNSKTISLGHFLNGLGIEGSGGTTWEKILDEYPTLKDVLNLTADQIVALNGFAEKSANQIVKGLLAKKPMIDDLLNAGVQPQEIQVSVGSNAQKLVEKAFVITGALSKPRGEIEKIIKAAGGKTSSSVSKNTFAVITDDPESNSSKMKKARDLGVLVWSEEDLEAALA